jgi:hypothetical protein
MFVAAVGLEAGTDAEPCSGSSHDEVVVGSCV